jgi:hypothetical protein
MTNAPPAIPVIHTARHVITASFFETYRQRIEAENILYEGSVIRSAIAGPLDKPLSIRDNTNITSTSMGRGSNVPNMDAKITRRNWFISGFIKASSGTYDAITPPAIPVKIISGTVSIDNLTVSLKNVNTPQTIACPQASLVLPSLLVRKVSSVPIFDGNKDEITGIRISIRKSADNSFIRAKSNVNTLNAI